MYFRNYRFRKTLLDKYLKSRFSEDPSTIKLVNSHLVNSHSNSAEIWMTRLLPDLLITVKVSKFEKVSPNDKHNLRTVFNTLNVDWLNRKLDLIENLNNSTFGVFIDQCEASWIGKIVSWWYAKCSDCLWEHWLLVTSLFFLIEINQRSQFICIYIKNKKVFLMFF